MAEFRLKKEKMTDKKLSRQEIITLIEKYEENPCLWDLTSNLYRRVDLKNKAWDDIATTMNMDVGYVKKKIKSLRGTYTGEKKKIKNTKSGQGADELYSPNLFWFDKMKFLDTIITERPTSGNFEEKKEPEVDLTSDEFDLFREGSSSIGLTISPVPSTSKKVQQNDKYTNALNSVMQFASSACLPAKAEPRKDEIDAFCDYMKVSLRKLPEEEALVFMEVMQRNLMRKRLSCLRSMRKTKIQVLSNERVFTPISASSTPNFSDGRSTTDATDAWSYDNEMEELEFGDECIVYP